MYPLVFFRSVTFCALIYQQIYECNPNNEIEMKKVLYVSKLQNLEENFIDFCKEALSLPERILQGFNKSQNKTIYNKDLDYM